jgi:hypothetical protein
MKIVINRRFYALASLVSLFAGMGIYLLFRNTNMLIFEWIPKLQFFKDVYVPVRKTVFSSIFLFNLSDTLWFLSGIFFLRFIWFYHFKEQNIYVFCFYLIAVVFEISQLSDNIPGTFDFMDLLFIGIIAFVEGLIYLVCSRNANLWFKSVLKKPIISKEE